MTVDIDGWQKFECGKVVTPLTPVIDELAAVIRIDDRIFEMYSKVKVPVFTGGRCTGEREEEISHGVFTEREILSILPPWGNRKYLWLEDAEMRIVKEVK